MPRLIQQWRKKSEDWRDRYADQPALAHRNLIGMGRRADELEEALEANERRFKERSDHVDPLRASENKYIREERLRDEINEVIVTHE